MNIYTSDMKNKIPLGGVETWKALCSTINYHLSSSENKLIYALSFLENGHCPAKNCLSAAREFNLIRDALSQIGPEKMVYDVNDINRQPPWGNKISPVITSCANYFTTGDGNDLLAEIVKILTIAAYSKVDVNVK